MMVSRTVLVISLATLIGVALATTRYGGNDDSGHKGSGHKGSGHHSSHIGYKFQGKWSDWKSWTPCSKPCDGGHQSRTRVCETPKYLHKVSISVRCDGLDKQHRACNIHKCPVDGVWTNWTPFSSCSETCGDGEKTRERFCTNPAPSGGGEPCKGDDTDSMNCNIRDCPVDGRWTTWTPFSGCSKTCRGGEKTRERSCTNPSPSNGGEPCDGDDTDSMDCNSDIGCAVDGMWTTWTPFSDCSKTCRGGEKTRERSCTNPPPSNGGEPCDGDDTDSMECNSNIICAVDGRWTTWTPFSDCSKTCRGGEKTRERSCTNPPPSNGGEPCDGDDTDSMDCNSDISCAIDGRWTTWTPFSSCSKTCEGGEKTRERSCTDPPPSNGGEPCDGDDTDSMECNSDIECAVDGGWTPWSQFTDCSKTCGGGRKTRVRTCTKPSPSGGGKPCKGADKERMKCNTQSCKVHGWSSWSHWSGECKGKCGVAYRYRSRTCWYPTKYHGDRHCTGRSRESQKCPRPESCYGYENHKGKERY